MKRKEATRETETILKAAKRLVFMSRYYSRRALDYERRSMKAGGWPSDTARHCREQRDAFLLAARLVMGTVGLVSEHSAKDRAKWAKMGMEVIK